jgi:DNA-binding CsgD family transcriptional regulator
VGVADGWSEHDVVALSRLLTHTRAGAGLSLQVLDDLRQITGADQVLLLERDCESAGTTAAAPCLRSATPRALSPDTWSALWDTDSCPLGSDPGDPVESPGACVTDHFHRPRGDVRVHRELAASDVLVAVLVSATSEARMVFVRRTRDFDAQDRTLLALLRPHLVRAYRHHVVRRGGADALTPRQRTVLHLVAHGCSNDEIATRLVLSTGTVRKHLDNAFRHLGVSSRAAAVVRAFPEGVPVYPTRIPLAVVPRQRAN